MNIFMTVITVVLVLCVLILAGCGFLPVPTPVPSMFVSIDKDTTGKTILHAPTCFRFKGKLYVLGGYEQKSDIPTYYQPKVVMFQEIHGMQYRSKIIPNKRMYEITDDELAFIIENNIKNSKGEIFGIDPATWKDIGNISSPKAVRANEYYLEFKGNIYAVGGSYHDVKPHFFGETTKYTYDNIDRNYTDVWKSNDAKVWKQIAKSVPWSTEKSSRQGYAMVATDNAIYLAGGYAMGPDGKKKQVEYQDVWKSLDGKNWQQEIGDFPYPDKNQTITIKGKSFLIEEHLEERSTLYISEDKINWQRLLDTKNMLGIFKGKLVMIVSEEDGDNLYFSTDGLEWRQSKTDKVLSWTPTDAEPDRDYYPGFTLLEFNDALWLVGQSQDQVYSTQDGLSWKNVEAPKKKQFVPRTGAAVGAFNGYLWIMGGVWNNKVALKDIWRSKDGQNWEQVTDNAPWGTSRSGSIVVAKNRLYLVKKGVHREQRTGTISHPREIWSTKDCVTWQKEAVNANNVIIEASDPEDMDRVIETKDALYFQDNRNHKRFLSEHSDDDILRTFLLKNFDDPKGYSTEVRLKGETPLFLTQKPHTFWISYNLRDWGVYEQITSRDDYPRWAHLFDNDYEIRKPVVYKNKIYVVGGDFLNHRVYSAEMALDTIEKKIKEIPAAGAEKRKQKALKAVPADPANVESIDLSTFRLKLVEHKSWDSYHDDGRGFLLGDKDNKPIMGMKIKIKLPDGNIVERATDASGFIEISGLDPGKTYDVLYEREASANIFAIYYEKSEVLAGEQVGGKVVQRRNGLKTGMTHLFSM